MYHCHLYWRWRLECCHSGKDCHIVETFQDCLANKTGASCFDCHQCSWWNWSVVESPVLSFSHWTAPSCSSGTCLTHDLLTLLLRYDSFDCFFFPPTILPRQ